jgi:cell division transport system permease protein
MANKNIVKPYKRKLFNAYFVSTLSITMVLFLIGLLSFVTFNARYFNKYIRENIGITLVLNEDVRKVDMLKLQKQLSVQPEVKTATYIDAEAAALALKDELGEDFLSHLGYNPLNATIDIKLNAAYTQNDSLVILETKYMEFPYVQEVYYQRNLVSLINENTNKIGLLLLGLGTIMLLIFVSLINNTIRLSIYSKRFIINTMLLVGATRGFIRKPIVGQSIVFGLLGALIANSSLMLIIISYRNNFKEIINYETSQVMLLVFTLVFVAGFFISWISTTFAVNKFLRLRYDQLFY